MQEPVAPIKSAKELEARAEWLRKSIWGVYGFEYTAEPDVRGRTFKQDVDEWLLPPASVSRLEALQSSARAQESAHQGPALRKTLDAATLLVQQEVYREDLINDYWFHQTNLVAHKRLCEQLEARLPQQARTGMSTELTAAAADAGKQLADALAAANPTSSEQAANTAKVRAAVDAEFGAYNQQRARLAEAVTAAERARGIAPLNLVRSSPCPPAPEKTSGKAKPILAPDAQPATELDYPEASKKADVEGFVVVRVTVSFAGCPLQAEVDVSSGVTELDQAALRWVLTAKYLPAEHEHQAVEAAMPLGVRFRTN